MLHVAQHRLGLLVFSLRSRRDVPAASHATAAVAPSPAMYVPHTWRALGPRPGGPAVEPGPDTTVVATAQRMVVTARAWLVGTQGSSNRQWSVPDPWPDAQPQGLPTEPPGGGRDVVEPPRTRSSVGRGSPLAVSWLTVMHHGNGGTGGLLQRPVATLGWTPAATRGWTPAVGALLSPSSPSLEGPGALLHGPSMVLLLTGRVNTSPAGWSTHREEKARQQLPGSQQPRGELCVFSTLVCPAGCQERLLLLTLSGRRPTRGRGTSPGSRSARAAWPPPLEPWAVGHSPAAAVTQPRRSLLLHAPGRCWRVSHPRVVWGLNVAACHWSRALVGGCPWRQPLPRLAGKPHGPLTLQVLLLQLRRKAISRSLETPVVAPAPSLLRSSPHQPCGAARQGPGGHHLCRVTPQPPLSSGYRRGREIGGDRDAEKLCHLPGRQPGSPSRRSDTSVLRK